MPPKLRGNILVVDDDADFRAEICALLRAAGYELIEAADGHQAIALLETSGERIDVAIIDLVLPGEISGFDLLGMISRHELQMRVLATSAVFRSATLEAVLRIGAHGILPKPEPGQPLDMQKWLSAVRAQLTQRHDSRRVV
jgi:DNA-binding response OmpR family regulator